MKKKEKEESRAKKVLINVLESSIGLLGYLEDLRHYQKANITGSRARIEERKLYRERVLMKQELLRLKKKKLIEERKTGNKLMLCLTEEGKQEILRYKILTAKNNVNKNYCVAVFDIPESERNIRDFFRRFLKEAGFIRLQQSVWVSQKDVMDYLIELVKSANAEKWVHLINATEISNFFLDKKYQTKG
jgi:DNA-binding transcriptional regulator PaaX